MEKCLHPRTNSEESEVSYTQEPPFAVQVEFVEGCNLYCNFCGLQGIRTAKDKTFKEMSTKTAKSLARQIAELGWNPRIEFAMHGEPTMHSEYVEMVRIFRKCLPDQQLMMTSNGGGLLRPPGVAANLNELFRAGLNVFAFDAYEYVKIKEKVDEQLEAARGLKFSIVRYPDNPAFSPHNRYGNRAKLFIRIKDISIADTGTHSVLNNHTGCGAEGLIEPLVARCAKPFRELSVRWDGNVAICCNDWRGYFKVGNVVTDGLEKVWHDEKLNAARRFLMKGDRGSVAPCNICDAKSHRVGLLPDKKGKKKLRSPNESDRILIMSAVKGKPYSKPVLRSYEEK
jgi:radical SAM protein with 4Fe4S-binding SPASM domain